ncbi:hypothetical protein LIER_30715 [Lithospermum erythrorhizon]|uniref:Uncharacterized protein n=1 Tax=Lithospermum erythrorhizon TaxID=34254 RepID=A0AAV3RNL7_LITER
MARTKRTATLKPYPPPPNKRSRSTGGVKIVTPPSSPPPTPQWADSTTMALAKSKLAIYQHSMELDGELTRERAKLNRLRKQLQELHPPGGGH